MDQEAAARQAYADAGHAPGTPASADWWGRICHAHRVAYPASEGMGPHFEMAHEEPAGYYPARPGGGVMTGWFWAAMFFSGVATGVAVWTLWGWPWMRDRYYRGKGVPDRELLP